MLPLGEAASFPQRNHHLIMVAAEHILRFGACSEKLQHLLTHKTFPEVIQC